MSGLQFYQVGKETSHIGVRVSYRIIQLFSDGLYSSPNKAVEELVSNAWDAGAKVTHIFLPADRDSEDAQIVVIDDGTGMDEAGLRQHWLLGDSKKRIGGSGSPRGRKPIGKFGIGKLATYVLAKRLTHVTKVAGRYWSTSMDYRQIDDGAGNATSEKQVELPLMELTEQEARKVVFEMVRGVKPNEKTLKLFGTGASPSWTVAVMSELKDMAKELSQGRLRWVLESAMPLSDDFHLYLNGQRILSSKLDAPKIGTWVLGKEVGTEETPLPRPAPDEIEESLDKTLLVSAPKHFGIFHPVLLRVTGFIEAYEDELKGKSDDWGQSNGFFVYVRGRRINIDDPGFGIDRNKLQHGTFARFRMVVHIDSLDDELRSSRESVREGDRLTITRAILWAGFNWARSRINDHAERSKPGAAMASRVAASPISLTARPIYNLLEQTLSGDALPRYIEVPKGLSKQRKKELLSEFEHPDADGFKLVEQVELAVLTSHDGIARYNVSKRVLTINTMHPFVAHFLNEFQSTARSLPLELFAMSEVLLEAHLYQTVGNQGLVQESLDRRDQLLRHLAKSSGHKNAFTIAQDLEDAARDKSQLEIELVNAFLSLGFEAVPRGGPNKPDGLAEAPLASANGQPRRYKVSLEAKSKEQINTKVSAKAVGISGIVRQRDEFECNHAIVVGPEFPASAEGRTALERELQTAHGQPERTITLMRVTDLARLVRIQPQKRIGLEQLRQLFLTCRMPEDSAAWVTEMENLVVESPPYRKILDVLWKLQQDEPDSPIDYGKLRTALRFEKTLIVKEDELRSICKSMMRLAGSNYMYAEESRVEVRLRPAKVLEAIESSTGHNSSATIQARSKQPK